MRPVLLFINFHLSFSFSGKTTGFSFGRDFRFRDTVTLCYGTRIRCSDFSSFGSPFGERFGQVVLGHRASCLGNPDQMFGLLILLVSFSESNSSGRLCPLDTWVRISSDRGSFPCGFIIAYRGRVVKGFFALSYILYTKKLKFVYFFGYFAQ